MRAVLSYTVPSAPNEPALYVAIATAGRPARCEKTLEQLVSVRRPASFRGLLLIENGPRLGVEALAGRFPALQIRYAWSAEPNKSAALNLALESIPAGALIVFLDDDVALDAGLLEAYDAAAREFGPGAFLGGRCLPDYGGFTPPAWMMGTMPFSVKGLDYAGGRGHSAPDIFFLGFNWAAWRDDLVGAGGFDPRFGPGSRTSATGQETEMQERLKARGLRGIYVPEAIVTHSVGRETFTWKWVRRRGFRNGVENGLRDPRRARGALLRLPWRALKLALASSLAWLRGDRAQLAARLHHFSVHLGECRARLLPTRHRPAR